MDWILEHWDVIGPLILAVLGLVSALFQRAGKVEAVAIATVLITAIESMGSRATKLEAQGESIRQDVAKPMAKLVEKVTDDIKAKNREGGGS